MTSEDDFQRMLDVCPSDWQTRLIFADWLRDHNDLRADGYQALGHLRLYPSVVSSFSTFGGTDHPCFHDSEWLSKNKQFLLPADWFHTIPYDPKNDWQNETKAVWRRRDTRRELEDVYALAFLELPIERQCQILNQRVCA